MKKAFSLSLIALTAISLAGCGSQPEVPETDTETPVENQTQNNTPEAKETPPTTNDNTANATAAQITKMAVQNGDFEECQKIEDANAQDQCVVKVREAEAQKETAAANQGNKTYESATQNGDPSQCATIENEQLKSQCEYDAITKKALNQKDESVCDQITDESAASNCKVGVQLSVSSETVDNAPIEETKKAQ